MKGILQESYDDNPDRIVGSTRHTIPNGSKWETIAGNYHNYTWTYYSAEEPVILTERHIKLVDIEDGSTVHLLNMSTVIHEITEDIVQPGSIPEVSTGSHVPPPPGGTSSVPPPLPGS